MNYLKSIILGLLAGFLMVCFPISTFSNNSQVNQSKQTILKDSLKILDSLVRHTMSINPDLSIHYAKEALAIARKLKTADDFVNAYSILGQAYYKNDKPLSFICFTKALKIADSARIDARKPLLLYNFANLHYTAKNFKQAIILFDSCIKVSTSLKDYKTMAKAYNKFGTLEMDIKDKVDAVRMWDSAYAIAVRHSDYTEIGLSLGNLALLETDTNKFIKINKEAISYLKKDNESEQGIARILNNIGNRTKNPDTALFYYREALKIIKNSYYPEVEMGAYNDMVYSYLDKGDIAGAESCLIDHAIPLAQKEKNYDWLATLADSYADVLSRKGDYKAAAQWQRTAMDSRMESDRAQASEEVRLLGVVLDLKSKELTIQDNKQEILVQQNRLQKTRLGLTITIFMIIGFVFIILWLQQRNRVKMQRQQIQSAKRIIDIEENEKQKISRELHDITGQLVLGITGEIENLELSDTRIKDEIKRKIKDLGQSIRLISHRMNKAMLDNFTYEELIEGQCEEVRKAVGLKTNLEMPAEPLVLNEETVLHTYRIVQELLTNAGKYARESYVSLNFQMIGSELNINYFDNGQGFDTSLIEKKGMGLMNIFERAKLLNGTATVTSAPGDGTTWEIKVPLVQEKMNAVKSVIS
jgi:signal transduction histidine kinase